MTAGPPRRRRPRAWLALGLPALLLATAAAPGTPTREGGDPARGAPLYGRYCAVCHGAGGAGDGPAAASLEDDRPRDLTDARYMGRLSDAHLYRVIADGGAAVGASRFMPPWGRTLSPTRIRDVVAYVRTLPTAARPAAAVAGGAGLARELGCPTCHRIGDLEPGAVGPDLGAQGSRVQHAWLVEFLGAPRPIRPAGYHPLSRSRMPDFRLSREEIAALAAYLVAGRDGAEEVVPEAALVDKGRDAFRRYACRACHRREGSGGRAGPDLSEVSRRLKPGWVLRLLQDPQAVDPLSPMPHLGVGPEDARAIVSYLFGGVAPPREPALDARAAREGRALFDSLGCGGCHEGARQPPIAPDLAGAGDRLRPEWLAEFLRRPSRLRPWLGARMPDFRLGDVEARALVEFLTGLRDAGPPLPERLRFTGAISPASVEAGRRLASREFLSCASCHVGEEQPEGSPEEWAPDLRLAGRRLDPDWIVRWLRDPQRLAPGTKMPSFFSDADSGPEEILEGDEERQILALRDYLVSLGLGGPPPLAPAAGR
jgi:mono/diheme cytochrome c family protein